MTITIHPDWHKLLSSEFNSPYFGELVEFVRNEYKSTICYPPGKDIFAAFDRCLPQNTKVVIIGQDPYHGPNQANGLCFSVASGIPHPPSLRNIFIELNRSTGKPIPESGDLSHWANQGVLLLNATLTVRANQAASHQGKGWEKFTDQVIRHLSDEFEGIIFLLWGGYARKKVALIDTYKHYVLESGHPSPLSANKGHWFGNNHFNQTNELLIRIGKTAIEW
jgi:uracil-DNA glycosylase